MAWLLNIVYLLAWAAASPWLVWRRWRWGKNRRGWTQKWFGLGATTPATRPRVWLHAVSVGEVNLLAPIMAELSRRGEFEFAISTTTETGYELAQKKYPQQLLFFCPFDFSWAVRRTLRNLRPEMIVLAELELWPNWIRAARKMGIPVVVANGRLSEKSFAGYRRLRWLVQPMFRQISLVVAQSKEYAARFIALGTPAEKVVITGNVKFDNVDPQKGRTRGVEFAKRYRFDNDQPVLVGGSTQPDEEQMLLEVFGRLRSELPQLRMVLVPRHPEKTPQLESLLRKSAWSYELRSKAKADDAASQPDVLVVDVIGELAAWWTLATVSYVGGSLGARGGQNMIEPAAAGSLVCFGPNTQNFRDVVDLLLAQQAALVVRNESELYELVRRALTEPLWAKEIGRASAELVLQHRGAAAQTAEAILRQMTRRETANSQSENRAA
jgi:3-deoxy-D-manno-octulosonic-acid transferase